jgi:hypothetical protein
MGWLKKAVRSITGRVADQTGLPVPFQKRTDLETDGSQGYPSADDAGPNAMLDTFYKDPWIKKLFEQTEDKFMPDVPDAPEFESKYAQDFMSAGRKESDLAAQSVRESLAGRGAGGIGSALGLSAQARSQGTVGALQAGTQADLGKYAAELQRYGHDLNKMNALFAMHQQQKQPLLDALTFKYQILSQIMGQDTARWTAGWQYAASRERTQAMLDAAKWEAGADAFGSIMDFAGKFAPGAAKQQ